MALKTATSIGNQENKVKIPLFSFDVHPSLQGKVYTEDEAENLLRPQIPFWKKPPRLSQAQIDTLYQMTADVDEIFRQTKLEYCIDGGTILGAIRHRGLIPWDDDVDFLSLEQNEPKFLKKALPLLKKRGYNIVSWWFGGYRIFPKDGDSLFYESECTYPFIDLFFLRLLDPISGELDYVTQKSRDAYGRVALNLHDIRPLRPYQFGDLQLLGPRNPVPYMVGLYGPDWLTTVYESYDHRAREALPMIKVRLREFRPALPSWNLL